MKAMQRMWVHAALLAVASAGALYVWTTDREAANAAVSNVRVWGGKPADVQKIVIETTKRQVSLESHVDDVGRWFEGTVTREGAAYRGDHMDFDDMERHREPPPPDEERKVDPTRRPFPIVSVRAAERIAEGLAPLLAVREVGAIEGDSAGDFGLAVPDGTMKVTVAGVEKTLLLGSEGPGGTDWYVRFQDNNVIYAIRGDIVRDLLAGDAAMNERELHAFEAGEVQSVRIVAGNKVREVKRKVEAADEGKEGMGPMGMPTWADLATPDQTDEALTSWMMKVDRLRPMEILTELPEGSVLVVRLEFVGKKGNVGFLELHRIPGADGGFAMRTEYSRRYVKTPTSGAEPVEHDLGTVLR